MKKDVNAYCYRIKGLTIPYDTPADIESRINNYIDKIGSYSQMLENCYNKKDTAGFIRQAEVIQELLQSVYATHCISYTKSLLYSADRGGLDYCHRVLGQAIADFLLLAIEMQKAQNIGINVPIKYKDVEKNEDIVRSLSAVGRFIDSHDYQNAKNIVAAKKEEVGAFASIDKALVSQDYNKAKEMAGTLEKEMIELITRVDSKERTVKIVLTVDDRPEILTGVSAALKDHYKVLGAPGGKVALDIMERSKIDLFFLDIDMPGMDGFELARRIRTDVRYEKTPILFLTGNSSREHITRAIKLGSNDFIVKPAHGITLLAKARKYMD